MEDPTNKTNKLHVGLNVEFQTNLVAIALVLVGILNTL